MLTLIMLCVGGSILLFFMAFTQGSKPVVSVADRVRKVSVGGTLRDDKVLQQSFFQRVMIPISDQMGKMVGNYTPVSMVKDSNKILAEAGLSNYMTGAQLAGFCWLLAMIIPVIILLMYANATMPLAQKAGYVLLGVMAGFRIPMFFVRGRAKKRKTEIVKSLPFCFDLLSISVEAGMGFDGALSAVAERSRGPLAEELNRTLTEIRLGKPRSEALIDLGERTNCDDLRSFTSAVSFISQLGGSLVEVLRVQGDAMRVKRRQRAEESAAKAPVKMMIPLVFFIFPCLFIVILGPAFIIIARDML